MAQMDPRTDQAWFVRVECFFHRNGHWWRTINAHGQRAPRRLDFDRRSNERLTAAVALEALEERRRAG